MNLPDAAPTVVNVRQRIVDAALAGLRSILVANKFETNLGQQIHPWKSTALAFEQLPAGVLRDLINEPVESSSKLCGEYKLSFELALVPPNSAAAPDVARKLLADVMKWLSLNKRWRDAATNEVLTYDAGYAGDEMHIDQTGGNFAGISFRFFALWKMRSLDPYTPQP